MSLIDLYTNLQPLVSTNIFINHPTTGTSIDTPKRKWYDFPQDVTDRIQLTPVALMEGMAMAKTMFSEAVGWDGGWSLGMWLL